VARPPLGRARRPPGEGVPPPEPPFGLYHHRDLKTPEQEEFPEFRRRPEVETTREEKTFPAGRFRRGELLPEGDIVIIAITIATSIIEIIITIIPIISTTSILIHLTLRLQSVLYLALFVISTLSVLITTLWLMLLSFVGELLL
jgi:hypothetical protein